MRIYELLYVVTAGSIYDETVVVATCETAEDASQVRESVHKAGAVWRVLKETKWSTPIITRLV